MQQTIYFFEPTQCIQCQINHWLGEEGILPVAISVITLEDIKNV